MKVGGILTVGTFCLRGMDVTSFGVLMPSTARGIAPRIPRNDLGGSLSGFQWEHREDTRGVISARGQVDKHLGKRTFSSWLAASGGNGGDSKKEESMTNLAKLGISLVIDLIGMSSYAIPALGEVSDFGWAPVSAALIWYLYGNGIIAGVAFVEEILPGLDVVPTATIAWFLSNSDIGRNLNAAASSRGGNSQKGDQPPPPPTRQSTNRVDQAPAGPEVLDVETGD